MWKIFQTILLLMIMVSPSFAVETMLGPVTPVIICNPDGTDCRDGSAAFPFFTTSSGGGGSTIVYQGTIPWVVSVSNIPHFILDSGVITSVTNPVTVTGTVTANQGTTPWVVSGTVTASGNVTSFQGGTWTVGASQSGAWTVGATQSGTWNIGTLTSITNPVSVTQGTSPWVVTGTVTPSVALTTPVTQVTSPWVVSVSNIPHVILDSGTITNITNPVTVTGTVIANQGTSPWIISGTTTTTGTVTANQGGIWTVNAAQSGTWNIGTLTSITNPVAVTGTFWQAIQPVSQSGTWNIGTLTSITNPVAVTGTFFQATQPVSLATLPALTTGSATIGNVNINGNGTVISGQQAVTTSAVALATNSAKGACVRSSINSTVTVYLGPSGVTTSTGHELNPGDSVCLPVSNTNLLFAISTSTGGTVTFLGSN